MKRNTYKRVYIIALLVAVLLVSGCSKGADAEPVHIIGFDELETESIASWREDMFGGYRLEKLEQGDLLRLFMDGEIPAYDRETDDNGIPFYESPFYVAEIYSGVEIKYKYTQLDNDEEYELVIQGPYGGTYLDARNGTVYVMACGQGTGCVLSYAEYDGLKWLVYSDTTHGGRTCYTFFRMDYTGAVVEEFTLNKFYWDYPQEPDGPNTVYEYNDEPISKEEYNAILEQIEITKTSWWYGE